MTKAQARECEAATKYIAHGLPGAAARTVSALIRAALRQKDADELRAFARAHGLTGRPEFVA